MQRIWTKTKAPSWLLACCHSIYSNPSKLFFPSVKSEIIAG